MKNSILFKKEYLYQYLATLTGSFSVILSGINIGWTSPYLPQILNGTLDIEMTNDQGSWCAVMPLVGAPFGAFMAAAVVDRIGRKYTTLAMAPIAAAMCVLLAFATSVWLICLARFIIGSVEGGLYTVLPIYIGEISHPSIRGILTSSLGMATIIGILYINVAGFYYSIFVSSLMSAVIPVIHFLTFIWMPESPYYYIKVGRIDEAEKNLKILRGTDNVKEEVKELCEAVSRQESCKKANIADLIRVKSNRRATIIFMILNLTKKFSGKNPFLGYTVMIFQMAEGSLNANVSVIIFLCIEVITAAGAITLLDRVGRRPVIITSTIGCTISLAVAGLYFFLKDQDVSYVAALGWLPLTALTFYNIFYNAGLEFAPTIYLGELYPTNIKAIALGVADTFSIINGTIASKLFQILMDSQGIYLPFWIFSGCCVVGLYFIVKYVPETKNKTLEEIQLYLIHETSRGKTVDKSTVQAEKC